MMNRALLTQIKETIISFGPAVLWAIVIFFFSSQEVLPGFEVSILDFLFKKSAHMTVFAVLFTLLWWGMARSFKVSAKHAYLLWLMPLMICLIYAVSDEWHQSFVSNRSPSLRDVGFDFLGAFTALLKLSDKV